MPAITDIQIEALLTNVQVKLSAEQMTFPVARLDGTVERMLVSPRDTRPFKVLGLYKWLGTNMRNGPDHLVVTLGEFETNVEASIFARALLSDVDNFKINVNIRMKYE
jgi:hypothetical protein